MSGFEADLSGLGAASSTLRTAADGLEVDLEPAGDVGPGRLGPAVAALLAGAAADVARARADVTDLAERVEQARDAYAELDTDVASRFDQGPW